MSSFNTSVLCRVPQGPATQFVAESMIERLNASGQFSSEQLGLVREELRRWLNHQSSLSFEESLERKKIGRYVIQELLGCGGSGQVFSALTEDGSERVALKVLRSIHSTDRFKREMDLVQRLAHPNVVISYEVGQQDQILYIAMEQLLGPDLQKYVLHHGPLDWKRSLDVMIDAARGLEHAHRRGLIHRDVKPGNLMFDGDEIVKVTDLGLAALSDQEEQASLAVFNTLDGVSAGTPDFMAPEQAISLSSATALSDVYSLGATWFYLLTGRSRIPGDSLCDKLRALRHNRSLGRLCHDVAPSHVRAVWEKMVAHQPENRYQSMTEVLETLESIRPVNIEPCGKRSVEVLIVEDNQDDLVLTVEMLRRANSSITTHAAHSVAEAVEQLRAHPTIDVVLLDLQLPDSFGCGTVQKMRGLFEDLPILVLTGQQDVSVGEACIAGGADDFASKNDLNANVLERMIFITLSRRSHSAESLATP
ncbi:protein kinase [Roseiconus nitratireducens]|uniref:Protein kinase n=1 Tax=Roseiconus nitratireducens TaxID=2605748 RepID=A0A5M6D4X0_9BACT|nr:protein kinase [Roseiconus nitratireducens]KAA5540245.1 protein kinase [Roseiconus nitratireducens]